MRRALTGLAALVAALTCPAPTSAQGLDLSCQFSFTRLDSATTNTLLVDTNAVYWASSYAAVPGTRIRIEGDFPYARYTSWNLYDAQAKPIAGLTDTQIKPDPGSVNPFLPGASRLFPKRRYTAFIEFGKAPASPRPNTIYADSPSGTFLLRIYVPDRGRDAKGGVPLPKVTLERAGSTGASPGLAACRTAQAPYPQLLNTAIADSRGAPDPTADGDGYPGRNPPEWRLFVNLAQSGAEVMLDNETGEDFRDQVSAGLPKSAGIFSNRDISYVFNPGSRGFGELLVLGGRAPTFADTRPAPATMPSGAQVRYFSFCQYEPISQRVIDCRSDDSIPVGADGRYTVVVSTAEQRPANARPECGVAWIPWGPATHGLLVYRQMLADPSFAEAIARIPEPRGERATMGEYYPGGEYLPAKAAFEARGCPAG
jgi:hypothetical protein